MHTSVVVIAVGRNETRPLGIGCRFIVNVIAIVLVAVMPEMRSTARSVFQRIADTHRCRVSSIQREHEGKK